MMPVVDPLGVMIGLALLAGSLIVLILDAILLRRFVRHSAGIRSVTIAAASTSLLFAAFLLYRLSIGDVFGLWIVAWEGAPIAAGLAMLAAAWARSRSTAVVAAIAAVAIVSAGIAWRTRDMVRRGGLHEAVMAEDASAARALLTSGAASRAYESAFRQRHFVHAASDVNVDLVTAFLDAGVDPNVEADGQIALIQAITASPIFRLHEIERGEHRERLGRTVHVLLDRGADPNRGNGSTTPIDAAVAAGLTEVVTALEAKGGRGAVKGTRR